MADDESSWKPWQPRGESRVHLLSNPMGDLMFFGRELLIRILPERINGVPVRGANHPDFPAHGWLVKFEAVPLDEGYAGSGHPPRFTRLRLDNEALQDLANQLWEAGFRPQAARRCEGQLEAVAAHLRDAVKVRDRFLDAMYPPAVPERK